jgi:hypothetical protein
MTIVASPTLVPELQAWFYDFVVNSDVNKYEVPAPVDVDDIYLPQRSFIEMLFNEDYSYNQYNYLYNDETRLECWPALVRQRLCIYPGSAKYEVLADIGKPGDNIFGLESADLTLLDALLGYRTDGTAVTIVDTTATIAFDATTFVLYANYDNLPTPLSKLIYLYLDLKLYGRYENYNNLIVVSTVKVLDTMYELLLIDEYFAYISARAIDVTFKDC